MTRATYLWAFHFIFRLPEAEASALLPPALEPLLHGGWAFCNVAIGEYKALRPASRPIKMGRRGHAALVRLYVRPRGTDETGFYGLKAICDDSHTLEKMALLSSKPALQEDFGIYDDTVGTVEIDIEGDGESTSVTMDTRGKPVLTSGSPFRSLSEAATRLAPPTRLYALDSGGFLKSEALERSGERKEHRLVRVTKAQWRLFDGNTPSLELCYDTSPLAYRWPTGFALAP